VSIPNELRQQYHSPEYDLDGTAVALGGQITSYKDPIDAPEETPCDVPINGVSCALALGSQRTVAEASNVETKVETADRRALTVARFAYARAEVALFDDGDRVGVRSSTVVNGLAVGQKHILTVGRMSVDQSTTLGGDGYEFKLQAALQELTFFGPPTGRRVGEVALARTPLEVDLQTDIPQTYQDLATNLDRFRDRLLPHSEFQIGDDPRSGKTIALHLVKHIGSGTGLPISNGFKRRLGGGIPYDRRAPNGLYLEKFGQLYFGELLVTPNSRRFTLMRFVLGCDQGGGGSSGDVKDTGSPGH